jgi:ribosomal protein S18 acetylase RimI-like enzyme
VNGRAPDPISVAPIASSQRDEWDRLYAAYAEFYRSPQTAAMRDRVWGWLHDPLHALDGRIATASDGSCIGLVHFRPFARPLAASVGGYIDDLFVAPEWRGRGAADALIEAVKAEGRQRGWSVLRWITADDNLRAQRFYERVGERTGWVTYQIPLA